MDRLDLFTETVEVLAALAILGAWMGGIIRTNDLIGQIVVLVALVAIFGDAAIQVMKMRTRPVANRGD